jgi:Carboxypeptidase regulatory-like domain
MRRNHVRPVSLFAALLVAATALLASGCLWGKVIDSDTGAPIPGASVSYVDSYGHTGTAITNSGGLYWFDSAAGPVPALGPVTLSVNAAGYAPFSQPTLVQYDDNPNASLANLSSFWDVQSFVLAPSGTRTDMAVTDLFPDNQPSGTLWARITNNGPGSLVSAGIQLSCEAARYRRAYCERVELGPLIAEGMNTSDPGQTTTANTAMGLDTSTYWYQATCSVQPLKGSYSDPNPVNDFYTELIPSPTGDLELQDILLDTNNQVGIRVAASGTTGDQFNWIVDIGANEYSFVGYMGAGSQMIWTGYYVTGTENVSASLNPCAAPETNFWNNQLSKVCSSASHSCW